ncbi:MAG: radical SAM protein [Promethearchaeota archaeon]|jgi:MoaA/NifB/PqqE/SkfB family radical SAM enzyme
MEILLLEKEKKMLKGIHFLLTYTCNYSCDHCFLYCSPRSYGTFTLKQIKEVINEAKKIGTVEWIYFEGGEPFLYYPILLEGIKLAKEGGFKVGIVTNSYWATNVEDAELWLKPFSMLGVDDISISDDTFHYENVDQSLSKIAKTASDSLKLPSMTICIEEPTVKKNQEKGEPIISGGAMFKGRAVEKLIKDLPKRSWKEFNKCPYEDLKGFGRIHVDSFGNAHICQGLSIGNFWGTPLSDLIKNYNAEEHPICGPLTRGGPAQLVKEYNLQHKEDYVDDCHLCYLARLNLIEKFPLYLAPRQVYGLD